VEIARRYIASLSAGGEGAEIADLFTEDYVQEEFPNRLMPQGATRDLAGVKAARERGRALLSAETFELVRVIGEGDVVAMELIWTGTVGAAAGPFAAGQQLRAQFAIFLEFRDGRIARQHNYDCFDPW